MSNLDSVKLEALGFLRCAETQLTMYTGVVIIDWFRELRLACLWTAVSWEAPRALTMGFWKVLAEL